MILLKRYQLIATDSVQAPKIYSIGFSDDPRVTRFGPSVRNQYIIHYVLSGKGSFNGNKVEKGQGFLIVPGMYEEYHSDESDPWSFLWIISEDPMMEYFFSRHCANEETSIFKFYNLYELDLIAKPLMSATNSFSSMTRISELFLHIFNACVAAESKPKKPITRIYLDFSVNYIKTNLHLPISVNDLCNTIGITQPYLYRIFKQELGLSPKQFILSCKLSEAKKLLLNTELSISQIADSVGYENVLEFSKFFSKQTNLSPTAYRQEFT
jgi:AraC family transcriptional regulator of arabinose operon